MPCGSDGATTVVVRCNYRCPHTHIIRHRDRYAHLRQEAHHTPLSVDPPEPTRLYSPRCLCQTSRGALA